MDIIASREADYKLRQLEGEQQFDIFMVTHRTQEEEWRRISESLHNGLGQIFYGVKMSLSQLSIQRATKNPEEFELPKIYPSDLISDAIRDTPHFA
jgi:signal transduction histidine kinase